MAETARQDKETEEAPTQSGETREKTFCAWCYLLSSPPLLLYFVLPLLRLYYSLLVIIRHQGLMIHSVLGYVLLISFRASLANPSTAVSSRPTESLCYDIIIITHPPHYCFRFGVFNNDPAVDGGGGGRGAGK